jgi:hypothetical protein
VALPVAVKPTIKVKSSTAIREIGDDGKPAEDKRDDVINCERIGRVASLRVAVFTAIIRAINYQTSHLGWDILFRHSLGSEY